MNVTLPVPVLIIVTEQSSTLIMCNNYRSWFRILSFAWSYSTNNNNNQLPTTIIFSSFCTQCRNYSLRLITGTLCSPLCDKSEMKFDKCLGQGNKLHVLRANWNGDKIILKIPRALESHSNLWQLERLSSTLITEGFKMSKKEIIRCVSETYKL